MIRIQKEEKNQSSISKGLNNVAGGDIISMSYSGFTNTLFYIFAACLVIPIIDVPLLGLSITAPIMFLIAVPCFLKPLRPWFHTYRLWILLAVWIWIGIFFSTVFNGVEGDINDRGLLFVIRYFYWLIAFIVTVYFTSQGQVIKKIAIVLGWSVFILALLRWGEVLIYGNIGAWTGTHLLSQNNYGVLFSTFSPFLLIMIFQQRGWKRLLAILGNLMLWGAVAINGSRGSWIAIGIGLGISVLFLFSTNSRKFSGLLILLLITAGFAIALWGFYPQFASAIQNRFETFENLDKDKSALVREMMVQKGLTLFEENPLFGIGAGRFNQESVLLDRPRILSYVSQDSINSRSSHNAYIQFLAEFGLAGSIPFGLLLIILSIRGGITAFKALRKNNIIPLAFLISFIQMSIHMWAIASLTGTVTWFIYGLVGAVIMKHQKSTVE